MGAVVVVVVSSAADYVISSCLHCCCCCLLGYANLCSLFSTLPRSSAAVSPYTNHRLYVAEVDGT